MTIRHDFQPIYYLLRAVGLWPFTITSNSHNKLLKEVHVHLFDCLWFFLSICVYLAATYNTYKDLEYVDPKEFYYFSYFIYNASETPTLVFGAIAIILNMLMRNRLVNILNSYIIFDREVSLFLFSRKTMDCVLLQTLIIQNDSNYCLMILSILKKIDIEIRSFI